MTLEQKFEINDPEAFEQMSDFRLIVQLSDKEYILERQEFSLVVLLSEFGGFNDGVTIFPAILMTIYNARMY